jgi:major membrane immunogen (membrane-anchored lipoprotein)
VREIITVLILISMLLNACGKKELIQPSGNNVNVTADLTDKQDVPDNKEIAVTTPQTRTLR